MCGKASRAVLARVVSTGTLLALLGVVGLSGVRGQEPEESGRCRITSWGFPQQSGFPGEERDEQESNAAGAAAESAPEEKKEEPPPTYLVMESLQGTSIGRWLDSRKIQISGWTEGSFTASTASDSNLPMGFNYRANQFLLQQNWLRIERPVDTTSKTEPSFGFHSDTILPGTDYRFTLARGVFDSQLTADHGQPARYGIDPIYFYAEGYFPKIARGMDVKLGRFAALYGVEQNDAVLNILASHAYTFIYDPFTHTGILTTTSLTEEWTVQAGAVLGSDVFIDSADNATFVGSAKRVRAKQQDSLLLSVIAGAGQFDQARKFHNPEVFDLVYTRKLDAKWNYSFESLYGFTTNVPGTGFANWFGILSYLTYELTPRLSATTRLEFFDDAQGQRTHFSGLYVDLTGGLNFRPNPSIIIRPEVRFDNNVESRPFEGKHSLFTAALDVILRW